LTDEEYRISSGLDYLYFEIVEPEVLAYTFKVINIPVLGIRDILVWIRIRGSVPRTNRSGSNSGSDSFLQ
jgi:hypothetical protein